MNLFLVRHTELEHASERCIGQSNVPLSEKGKKDIDTLVEHLKPLAPKRLISSDLSRCLMLAKRLGEALSTTVEVKRAWREVNFGMWENQSWDELRVKDAERLDAWMKDFVRIAPPEGESFHTLQSRIVAELNALKESNAETVLVVTHAGAIRAALSSAIGLPLERAFSIHLNYGALVHLNFKSGIWTLENLNNILLSSPCDQPTTCSR
ncbi:MAG: alpha-ribazole phosphatase [Chloroherpetonaceae bacterium]